MKDIRHEYNGVKLYKFCEAHGAKGRWAKGDHRLEHYKNSVTVIPARVIGHGLQCKIVKWMEQNGLIPALAVGAIIGICVFAF